MKKIISRLLPLFLAISFFTCEKTGNDGQITLQKDNWRLSADRENAGLTGQWFAKDFQPAASAQRTLADFQPGESDEIIWGFTDFSFSSDSRQNNKWGLRLNRPYSAVQIWLNGMKVEKLVHSPTTLQLEVTKLLVNGENRLTIRFAPKSDFRSTLTSSVLFHYFLDEDLYKGRFFSAQIPAHPEWLENAVFYKLDYNPANKTNHAEKIQKLTKSLKRLGATCVCLSSACLAPNILTTTTTPAETTDSAIKTDPHLTGLVQALHDSGMYVLFECNLASWLTNAPDADKPFQQIAPTGQKFFQNLLKSGLEIYQIDGYLFRQTDFFEMNFWKNLRDYLLAMRPLLLIGETDNPQLHTVAFDALIPPFINQKIAKIVTGNQPLKALAELSKVEYFSYPRGSTLLHLTPLVTKQPEPAGCNRELLNTVLAFTSYGNPFVLPENLTTGDSTSFLEDQPGEKYVFLQTIANFYFQYSHVLKTGEFRTINNNLGNQVLSYERFNQTSRVLVLGNLTDKKLQFTLDTASMQGYMQDIFRKINLNLAGTITYLSLKPHEYRIYINARFKIIKPKSVYIPLGGKKDF